MVVGGLFCFWVWCWVLGLVRCDARFVIMAVVARLLCLCICYCDVFDVVWFWLLIVGFCLF